MRIIFIRQQDYWIFPLSVVGALLVSVFLYAGVTWIRLVSGLLGIGILYFIYSIIRKNYSYQHAIRYLAITLVSIVLAVLGLYYLTN